MDRLSTNWRFVSSLVTAADLTIVVQACVRRWQEHRSGSRLENIISQKPVLNFWSGCCLTASSNVTAATWLQLGSKSHASVDSIRLGTETRVCWQLEERDPSRTSSSMDEGSLKAQPLIEMTKMVLIRCSQMLHLQPRRIAR